MGLKLLGNPAAGGLCLEFVRPGNKVNHELLYRSSALVITEVIVGYAGECLVGLGTRGFRGFPSSDCGSQVEPQFFKPCSEF